MSIKKKIKNNRDKIKDYLLSGRSITRVEAMQFGYGMDLPQRIYELKQRGMRIDDEYIKKGSKQKRYFLVKDED